MPIATTTAPLTKYYEATVEDGRVGPGEVICVLTTDRVDRDNEVIIPGGAVLDNYRRNPVVMYGHAKGLPSEGEAGLPVGTNLWIKPSRDGHALVAKHSFDMNDPFSERVYGKVKRGVLRTYSITFLPIEYGPPTKEEIRRRPDWASAKTIYRKWELIEDSVVAMPANVDAETLMKTGNMSRGKVMPYELARRRSGGKTGWVVRNTETGRTYSNEPLSHDDALAQLRALYVHTDGKGASFADAMAAQPRPVHEREGIHKPPFLEHDDDMAAWSEESDTEKAAPEGVTKADPSEGSASVDSETPPESPSTSASPVMRAFDPDHDHDDDSTPEGDTDHDYQPPPDEEEEEEETEESNRVRKGDHVRVRAPHVKGHGVVVSVHKGEMVPHVEDDVYGGKADPAARVKLYKRMDDGYMPTKVHKGVMCKHLDVLGQDERLRPPSRKAKQVHIPDPEPRWTPAETNAYIASKFNSPTEREKIEARVAEMLAVRVLGKVAP